MTSRPRIPKDLGIKIGTKEEKFWTGVKENCNTAILNAEREIVINNHILLLAEIKIKEEKEKA